MRSVVGRSAILSLGVLTSLFVLYLLAMVLNHAPSGRAHHGMMSGDMPDDPANGRPLEASFGVARGGQQCKTDANGETGTNWAHFHSPGEYR